MSFKAQWPKRLKVGAINDPLKKAIGYKKGHSLKVIDVTGGLFRDAHHMATMGCQVTAVEEIEELASAFQSLLKTDPVENLIVVCAKSEDFLKSVEPGQFDLAYYDPMFPEKKKSALPGKEAQLLQKLAEKKTVADELRLLNLCLERCRRVVVKRPLRAEPLLLSPSHEIKGKAVRFDVYITR